MSDIVWDPVPDSEWPDYWGNETDAINNWMQKHPVIAFFPDNIYIVRFSGLDNLGSTIAALRKKYGGAVVSGLQILREYQTNALGRENRANTQGKAVIVLGIPEQRVYSSQRDQLPLFAEN